MAVLTEAIEAERGAGAATATAVGLVVTATAMTTVLVATSIAGVAGPVLALDPPMMTVTTDPPVVRAVMNGTMTVALAVNVTLADVALPRAEREPQS